MGFVACTAVCHATIARWEDIPVPFLGNGSINKFPLLGSIFLKLKKLDYKIGRAMFSTWFVPRCYKQGTKSADSQFSTGLCEERT
jgi:hypothetical protein